MLSNKNCLFIGSKKLGLKVLEALYNFHTNNLLGCVTIDDTNDVRSTLDKFKEFTQQKQLAFEVLNKPSQLEEVILRYQPDFCIVVGWYWVLATSVLKLVPNGFFGVHASLLPKYRGGSPLVWQIINGEQYAGVTLFRFDECMDTGDIFGQEKFAIEATDTIQEALIKAEKCTLGLLEKKIPMFIKGDFNGRKQNNDHATYCSMRKPGDGKIDWQWSSDYIYNFIRAQSRPYPGAFCFRETGERLTIWNVQKFAFDYYGVPGRVNQIYNDGVIITCGDRAIIAQTVQTDNGMCVDAREILKFGETLK